MKAVGSYKALSMTLAVLALVTSTACTRDKGGKEAQPGAPKTAAPPLADKAPTPLIPGSSGSNGTSDANDEIGDQMSEVDPGSSDVREGSVHYDPTGMTPEQIRAASEAQGPALVGPKSELVDFAGAELFFSGSGQDNLREIITAHNESREDAQKQLNADLVRRIKGASVDVDWNTRTIKIDVTLERGGNVRTFSTRGPLTNSLTMKSTEARVIGDMSYDATCMDREGGCSTVHVMVQEKSVNGTRTAHILVRKSPVAWFLEANATDRFANQEFNEMLETMWLRDEKSVRRVEKVEMETAEIVGGQSSFLVRMLTRKSRTETEWIMFSGSLVKPQTSSDTNVMIDVVSRGPLATSIRDVRMTYNDGRGNLRAVVTVRKSREDEKEASLILTFARVHQPTREMRLK